MAPEAPLVKVEGGLAPAGEGWFVVNARDAQWLDGDFGAYVRFESEAASFDQLGINVAVLVPGQPSCLYHREGDQEDFLVLAGDCRLLIEGEERPLRAWDFVHCPPWTEHVFVGAGERGCVLLGVGARTRPGVVYPASELAQRHGAGVARETESPVEAYASMNPDRPVPYREGWLPGHS